MSLSFVFCLDQLDAAGERFVAALPEVDKATGRTIFHAARSFLLSPPAAKLRVQPLEHQQANYDQGVKQ